MPDLPMRILGRTGLRVTALGFGALELRGMVAGVGRPLTPGQPERILNAVLDAGINYIDVAVDYGEAEEHIGRYISSRRQEFFLASKCGCPLDVTRFTPSERTKFGVPLPRLHDYSRKNIMDAVHQSLRRMQTDYLDVVQFHFSPAREVLEHAGAIETLYNLQRAGKVRFLGCSSILPNLTDHITMGVFDVFQIRTRPSSQSTRRPLPRRPGVERASSSAAAWPAVSRAQGRAPPTSGSSGSTPRWTSCWRVCRLRSSCCASP